MGIRSFAGAFFSNLTLRAASALVATPDFRARCWQGYVLTGTNAESRRYPTRPFLGVGALIFDADRILLVERAKEPLKGFWSIPGGIVETGEKLEEAIRREVLEETGLEVEALSIFEIFERVIPDAEGKTEYHYVLIDYLCRRAGGRLQAASDVSRVAWISKQELPNYRITEGTLAVVERAFAKLQP
ncbi:MAG TPA: NUDIX hydrolase [Bryobacteraceae bacterium]|nr:NUDIX hydrolase [Bryobacteraceae bacterium]